MAVYNLRNGLTIDLKFDKPTIFPPGLARLKFQPGKLYDSKLDAFPFPLDVHGDPLSVQVVQLTATGILTGASLDVFNHCSLRFIQLIQVESFNAIYQGKRPDQGSVSWEWHGQLLLRNIDCLVNDDGTNTSPFQFDTSKTEHESPNKLIAKLRDTPGATLYLAEFNRESQCDNYLWLFGDRRRFESIVAFVHPDGSFQVLESWKWNFRRSVKLKWVKLAPAFDDQNYIHFNSDASQVSVFGKDAEYTGTLTSGRIANKLTNEAMNNLRSSPNISYVAQAEATIFPPPERFWVP